MSVAELSELASIGRTLLRIETLLKTAEDSRAEALHRMRHMGCMEPLGSKDPEAVLPIRLAIDIRNANQVSDDLALLAQAAEAHLDLGQLALDLGDLGAHFRCVYQKDVSAMPAGQLVFDLEYSDALAAVLAAVRARYFDAR